mmetsp:Transcript_6176/g.13539  ORF Transcript_6176/g.13539 Transcript_6176/m.13539 type:complete len:210 (-) Transcript_6176:35-664(-)
MEGNTCLVGCSLGALERMQECFSNLRIQRIEEHVMRGKFDPSLLQDCGAFVLCADADQSRLLISDGTRDAAPSHALLEHLWNRWNKFGTPFVVVVTGGERNMEGADPLVSPTVTSVLQATGQASALRVHSVGRLLSWTDTPSEEQVAQLRSLLKLDVPCPTKIHTLVVVSATVASLGLVGFLLGPKKLRTPFAVASLCTAAALVFVAIK